MAVKPRKLRVSCDACSRAKVKCDKVRTKYMMKDYADSSQGQASLLALFESGRLLQLLAKREHENHKEV